MILQRKERKESEGSKARIEEMRKEEQEGHWSCLWAVDEMTRVKGKGGILASGTGETEKKYEVDETVRGLGSRNHRAGGLLP